MRDRENAEWVEAEEQDLPPHLRKPKEGEPLNLKHSLMDNPNPTFKRLKPSEMVDKTVLLPPNEDGTQYRSRILECIEEYKKDLAKEQEKNEAHAKFRCIVNNQREEVIAYNDICDFIEQDWTWDGVWKFR